MRQLVNHLVRGNPNYVDLLAGGTRESPLGQVTGHQALAVRTTDSAVHAGDPAQSLGVDNRLDPGLVAWISEDLETIYAGLA
ncbi:hypothetical protein SAMN05421854_121106 [Amycolatopsis rubida]|uniref:Uncharacterized protein n=1 Tax=Amycolatopsis rubida TaxID=112413 RepID=A0A1I6AXM3_9PSEU|nr:hypothetical protein SAMN05421854_121106 [Amycolatopsis rubida]